jgi:hypothetical protein
MDHKNCLINPATGRAIRADSKTGQRILNAQNKKENKEAPAKKSSPKKSSPKKSSPKKEVVNTMYKDAKAVKPNRSDFEKNKAIKEASKSPAKKSSPKKPSVNKTINEAPKPPAKKRGRPKKIVVNTMSKDASDVGPNKADLVKKESVKKESVKKESVENQPEKVEPVEVQPVKNNDGDLKNIIDNWEDPNIGVLFYQTSKNNKKIKNMLNKISTLNMKNKYISKPDIIGIYPELLNAYLDKYGASKESIRKFDESLNDIIIYLTSDEGTPKLRDDIDYKYYSKFMTRKHVDKYIKTLE